MAVTPFAVACSVGFALGFCDVAYIPVLPFMMPNAWVGPMIALSSCGSLVAQPVVGPVCDRVGAVVVMKCAHLILAISTVLAGSTPLVAVQVLARLTLGIGTGMLFNATMAYIMQEYQEPQRTANIGRTLGVCCVGSLVGPMLTGYIYEVAAGQQVLTFVPQAAVLLVSFAVLSSQSSTKPEPLLDRADSPHSMQLFAMYRHDPQAQLLGALLFLPFVASSGTMAAAMLAMHDRGLLSSVLGVATIPNYIVQGVVNVAAGAVARTPVSRHALLVFSQGVIVAGLVAVALVPMPTSPSNVVPIVAALCATFAGQAGVDAPSMSLMSELAASRGLGNGDAMAASEFMVMLGGTAGPIVGQALYVVVGFHGLCWCLAGASVLATIATGLCLKRSAAPAAQRADFAKA
eukprot:NODE_7759_length_1552_cov_13.261053.p1 GENE.NODE_7759_length_1552_cov_13.261053~~NODE_7759_length_1552_cov_13.261053.p1  ORF type:complete len:404 (-),score=77.99 NODE_7759_length_1552_cov_13.261053:220-1431(-)